MVGPDRSEVESRFNVLRKNLDEAGYLESFGFDSLRLVEHLYNDLKKTTESLQDTLVQYSKYRKIAEELEEGVTPFKEENVRLYKENSQLRMSVARVLEEAEDKGRDPQGRIRDLEAENSDLKLLVSQFAERVKKLEIESLEKTKRLVRLQEKDVGVSISLGEKGKKMSQCKQSMEVDYYMRDPCPHCIRLRNYVEYGKDSDRNPKTIDYVKMADSRIEALQLQLRSLKNMEKEHLNLISSLKSRISTRDSEINKLRDLIKVRPGKDNKVNGMAPYANGNLNRNLEAELRTAEMQLEMMQRRNMELEEKLKKSILQEHEDYMLGKISSHFGDRNVARIFLEKELDKYPSHDKMSLLEKLYYLERQLSHCCKEKAILQKQIEDCKLNHADRKNLGVEYGIGVRKSQSSVHHGESLSTTKDKLGKLSPRSRVLIKKPDPATRLRAGQSQSTQSVRKQGTKQFRIVTSSSDTRANRRKQGIGTRRAQNVEDGNGAFSDSQGTESDEVEEMPHAPEMEVDEGEEFEEVTSEDELDYDAYSDQENGNVVYPPKRKSKDDLESKQASASDSKDTVKAGGSGRQGLSFVEEKKQAEKRRQVTGKRISREQQRRSPSKRDRNAEQKPRENLSGETDEEIVDDDYEVPEYCDDNGNIEDEEDEDYDGIETTSSKSYANLKTDKEALSSTGSQNLKAGRMSDKKEKQILGSQGKPKVPPKAAPASGSKPLLGTKKPTKPEAPVRKKSEKSVASVERQPEKSDVPTGRMPTQVGRKPLTGASSQGAPLASKSKSTTAPQSRSNQVASSTTTKSLSKEHQSASLTAGKGAKIAKPIRTQGGQPRSSLGVAGKGKVSGAMKKTDEERRKHDFIPEDLEEEKEQEDLGQKGTYTEEEYDSNGGEQLGESEFEEDSLVVSETQKNSEKQKGPEKAKAKPENVIRTVKPALKSKLESLVPVSAAGRAGAKLKETGGGMPSIGRDTNQNEQQRKVLDRSKEPVKGPAIKTKSQSQDRDRRELEAIDSTGFYDDDDEDASLHSEPEVSPDQRSQMAPEMYEDMRRSDGVNNGRNVRRIPASSVDAAGRHESRIPKDKDVPRQRLNKDEDGGGEEQLRTSGLGSSISEDQSRKPSRSQWEPVSKSLSQSRDRDRQKMQGQGITNVEEPSLLSISELDVSVTEAEGAMNEPWLKNYGHKKATGEDSNRNLPYSSGLDDSLLRRPPDESRGRSETSSIRPSGQGHARSSGTGTLEEREYNRGGGGEGDAVASYGDLSMSDASYGPGAGQRRRGHANDEPKGFGGMGIVDRPRAPASRGSNTFRSIGVNTETRHSELSRMDSRDDAQEKRILQDKIATLQRKLDEVHQENKRHQLKSFELQGELERTRHMLQVEKQDREMANIEMKRLREMNSENTARLLMNSALGSDGSFRRGTTPMEMEREIVNLRAALSSLDRDKDEMRVELDRKDEKLARVMNDVQRYLDEISQLKLRLKNAELQISHTGESAKEQSREADFLKKQLESNRRDLEKTIRERDDALRELHKISGAHAKGQMERRSVEKELELKNKEADDLRRQVQRYIDEVRRIEELLLDKEEELETLLQHYRTLTAENNNLEAQRTSLEREAYSIRESVKDAVDQNITFKTQLASQNALVQSLEEEIQRFTQQIAHLENQLEAKAEKEKILEAEAKASKDLIYRLEVQMDKLKLDLADSDSKRKQLEAENAELNSHITALEARLQDETERQLQLEAVVANSREKDFQLERTTLDVSRERDQLAEKLTALQQRSESLNSEVSRYRLKSIELQNELDRMRRQLESEKRERDSTVSELKKLREHLHSSSANLLLNTALGTSSSSSRGAGIDSSSVQQSSTGSTFRNVASDIPSQRRSGSREQSPFASGMASVFPSSSQPQLTRDRPEGAPLAASTSRQRDEQTPPRDRESVPPATATSQSHQEESRPSDLTAREDEFEAWDSPTT